MSPYVRAGSAEGGAPVPARTPSAPGNTSARPFRTVTETRSHDYAR